MSIQDYERRKALQQKEAQVLEAAADLFNQLQAFSKHKPICARWDGEEHCSCGYTKLIAEIDKFLGV